MGHDRHLIAEIKIAFTMKPHSNIQTICLAVNLLCALLLFAPATAQPPVRRISLREKDPAFFKTEEARRIGDQIIAYQRCTGGWPKTST